MHSSARQISREESGSLNHSPTSPKRDACSPNTAYFKRTQNSSSGKIETTKPCSFLFQQSDKPLVTDSSRNLIECFKLLQTQIQSSDRMNALTDLVKRKVFLENLNPNDHPGLQKLWQKVQI